MDSRNRTDAIASVDRVASDSVAVIVCRYRLQSHLRFAVDGWPHGHRRNRSRRSSAGPTAKQAAPLFVCCLPVSSGGKAKSMTALLTLGGLHSSCCCCCCSLSSAACLLMFGLWAMTRCASNSHKMALLPGQQLTVAAMQRQRRKKPAVAVDFRLNQRALITTMLAGGRWRCWPTASHEPWRIVSARSDGVG